MTEPYEPTIYHTIHTFTFGGPVSKDYVMEGCGRCGAAVPAALRAQHEQWHATLERNTNTQIVMQRNLRRVIDWLKKFEELNK